MTPTLLAHGGMAGAIAEGIGVLLGLAALSYFVWRSTKGKIDEYDVRRASDGDASDRE